MSQLPALLNPTCCIDQKPIDEARSRRRSATCSIGCNSKLHLYRRRKPTGPVELYCVACTAPIAEVRARQGNSTTCSPVCAERYRVYRAAIQKSFRCQRCYRPTTPEEIESYKQWRKSQGNIQDFVKNPIRRGNPHYPKRIAELEAALREAVELLTASDPAKPAAPEPFPAQVMEAIRARSGAASTPAASPDKALAARYLLEAALYRPQPAAEKQVDAGTAA